MSNKVCFIIAHKYYRGGRESHLPFYIQNIQRLYPDALSIVVDNNSKFVEDIFEPLRELYNVVLLHNNCEDSGFEIGAYKVGIQYILDNKLTEQYSYFIFSQENFVLRNKFDFDQLIVKQIYALPINDMHPKGDGCYQDISNEILKTIGLQANVWDQANSFCWCCSFAVVSQKIEQLYKYLRPIRQHNRIQSESAERFLSVILWELNDRRPMGSIDQSCLTLPHRPGGYDCWDRDGDSRYKPVSTYFRKTVFQRNEHTKDQ